jgi:hypothetical protein
MANTIGWGQAAVNNTIDWGKGKTNNAIGWGNVYSNSPSGETDISGTPAGDADAQAFITAAAITDTTQKAAIDKLVVDLKGYGIWTKMKAIYPFIGGTSTQHKYNLKDPRDLDAAFRLVFNGGWTHSSTGALPNGTNAYANTYLILSNQLGSDKPHISYYSRTNGNTATDQIDMGVYNNPAYCWISAWYNGSGFSNTLARNTSPSVLLNGGTTSDSRGLYQTNKILTVSKLQKNNNILDSQTDTAINVDNASIYIGALNDFGSSANSFTNRQTAFNAIGSGLTDTEAANYYTAVQAFQTTLGRNV